MDNHATASAHSELPSNTGPDDHRASALANRLAGSELLKAMRAGLAFIDSQGTSRLLDQVGQVVPELPPPTPVDKTVLPASYGGGSQESPCDDFLVGRGMFYLTEQSRLFLDCTSGHYQMLWGYSHPELCRAIQDATEAGVVWDNHTNVPQTPVKHLAHRLIERANSPDQADPIDKVLLGCCTGSASCAAALKMQLVSFERKHGETRVPVMVVLEGNYHGTDMVAQRMRGMWDRYVRNLRVVAVQPNRPEELEAAFSQFGDRIAAFWAEPIMMNREAIVVQADYLQLARRLCDEVGAAMCIDEIQTGFWQPDLFSYRSMGFTPDMVITGKGMTAGFHPLSAVLFRSRYDVLKQYDAISTNGTAALAAYVALCVIDLIDSHSQRIVEVGDRFARGMNGLVEQFGDVLIDARGCRHMMGLKFHRVEEALDFHRRAVDAGLWIRAHAYHEGHSTVLTKLGLLADEEIADFVVAKLRSLLKTS